MHHNKDRTRRRDSASEVLSGTADIQTTVESVGCHRKNVFPGWGLQCLSRTLGKKPATGI